MSYGRPSTVGISRQRNSGYRPSRVNIMAQGLSTPDPSLSSKHLSVRRGRATTHYTHHQVSLMVSRNTIPLYQSLPWGCALGQPVRQASALACKGSVCHPKYERRKKEVSDTFTRYGSNITNVWQEILTPMTGILWRKSMKIRQYL